MGRWWRWALVSADGVVPSRMVSVSAFVNLPLHHKSRSSLLALAHPGGTRKRAVKRLWKRMFFWYYYYYCIHLMAIFPGCSSSSSGSLALWLSAGLDQRSYSMMGPISTRMGEHLRAGKLPVCDQPLRPSQTPTLSWTENEHRPKCVDALQLGSKGRYGSLHL